MTTENRIGYNPSHELDLLREVIEVALEKLAGRDSFVLAFETYMEEAGYLVPDSELTSQQRGAILRCRTWIRHHHPYPWAPDDADPDAAGDFLNELAGEMPVFAQDAGFGLPESEKEMTV